MAKCVHGVERTGGFCNTCETDRGDRPLDRCQCCGRHGIWGIRSHPKYSIKVGMVIEGELDMAVFYAHDERSIWALENTFSNDGFSDVIAVEHFDGKEWVEIHRP